MSMKLGEIIADIFPCSFSSGCVIAGTYGEWYAVLNIL